MAANPNWARWIFASTAYILKTVATSKGIAVIVEGMDDETDDFTKASDRVEVRVSGPFDHALAGGEHRITVHVNILITSRFDSASKNRHTILKNVGLYQEALSGIIKVYKFGSEVGDDPEALVGCLTPKTGKNDEVKVFHFGKLDPTDKIQHSMVDGSFEMYLLES